MIVDMTDDLAREDLWLMAILFLDSDLLENRCAGGTRVRLRLGVNLEEAVVPFDNLHPRPNMGCLEGDVGQAVDLDPGRDLHPQRRVTRERQEALRNGPEKRRVLGLQRIQENVRAKVNMIHRTLLPLQR